MALKPFMRWVGGKVWFTKHIDSLLPDFVTNCEPFEYGEPFLGGGSIYIHMQERYYPRVCHINDKNPLVYNTWKNVQTDPVKTVVALQQWKSKMESCETKEEKRLCWRALLDSANDDYQNETLDSPEFAAKLIFLTKSSFKSKLELRKDKICACVGRLYAFGLDYQMILDVSKQCLSKNTHITNLDYKEYFQNIKFDNPAFVFLDPPYHGVLSKKYIDNNFTEEEHKKLKGICDQLDRQGIKFILTNSCNEFTKIIFKDYNQLELTSKQSMALLERNSVKELIVRNY